MALFRRLPDLPAELAPAWQAFLDCAGVLEGGVRSLLGTLPIGRVEPAPVALGVTALRDAVAGATGELEELQEAVHEVVGTLDAFADAERGWRRTWRVPRG